MGCHRLGRCVYVAAKLVAVWVFCGTAAAHPGLDEQIAELSQRIDRGPVSAPLFLERGEVHRAHRDWPAAEADYRRAIELDPRLHVVQLAKARMLLEAGQAEAAREAAAQYLRHDAASLEGFLQHARSLAALGRHLDAAREYARAIRLGADDHKAGVDLYLERAQALAAAGNAHLDEAIRGLDEGLDRLHGAVSLQLLAIDLELRRQRPDDAVRRLDTIAALAGRKETWLLRKAEVLEQFGRRVEAASAYRQTLAAIEALPAGRRMTRAVATLRDQATAALTRLAVGP